MTPKLSIWKGWIGLPRTTMADVAFDVARSHRISIDDLKGHSRRREVAWPRQEAFARCRELGRSFPQIARYFGDRDHTTIIHGVRAHHARVGQG